MLVLVPVKAFGRAKLRLAEVLDGPARARLAREMADRVLSAATGHPVAVVCDGSMPTERTVLTTLGGLAEALVAESVRPPAIIVVGEVVAVAHPSAAAH